MSAADELLAVVLAAGLSRRFGGDKLMAPWRGKPLGAHIAETLAGMGLIRIAICQSEPSPRRALFAERGFAVIDNPDPGRGMGSSLAIGAVEAMRLGAGRVLVCLADMPNVDEAHLWRLLAAAEASDVVATIVGNVRSPPAVFGHIVLGRLAALTGDKGARELLRGAAVVEGTAEMVRDFDAPGDFDQGESLPRPRGSTGSP